MKSLEIVGSMAAKVELNFGIALVELDKAWNCFNKKHFTFESIVQILDQVHNF